MDVPTPPPGQPKAAAMRFIMITVLIDMMSVGLIVPVLPGLVGTFTDNQTAQAFWTACAAGAYGLANFFGSSMLGALSDRYGRRPVLLMGFCGFALSFFATALVSQLWMLIVVRGAAGALQANASAANAYVADITAPADRAKRFGMLGAMFGLGFTLGPALGGFLASFDLRWPFWVAGTLSLLNLIYGIAVLPESLPPERRQAVAWWRANPFTALRNLARLRGVGLLLAVLALSSLAQFILHTTWVLYTQFRFQWGPFENGWSLFVVGLVSVLVQGVLLRHLLARWGAQRLALIGLVSGSVAYLLWGLSTQSWMVYAVIGLNLLGFSAASVLQSIVSNAASAETQGQTLGAVSSLNSLMLVLAPMLGGATLTWVSHLAPDDWRLGAPFFLSAALQAVAALLALRHFTTRRNKLAAQAAT